MVLSQEEHFRFRNITEKDGFNPTKITCMLQDRAGYIWYGTSYGLIKYDGYTNERFTNRYNDTNTISGNHIYGLAEDTSGKIWIATTHEGLNVFDPKKKRFTVFRHKEGDSNSLISDRLMRLNVDRNNKLWIGYVSGGWSVFDIDKNKFKHFKAKTLFIGTYGADASNTPDPMQEAPNGGMWLTSGYGLHFQDTNNIITTYCDKNRNNAPQNDNLFISICQSDDTTVWVGTWGAGLKKFNTRTKQFTQFLWDRINPVASIHNIVMNIAMKSENELWIGSADKGLGVFNTKTEKFTFIPHDPEIPSTPLAGECYKILVDHNGTLWAGFYSGLSKLISPSNSVIECHIKNTLPEYERHMGPISFFKDSADDILFVGCISGLGLYVFDEESGKETVLKIPNSKVDNTIFEGVDIYAIYPRNKKELILATSCGLFVFEKSTRKITPIHINDQENKPARVSEILKGNHGYWCNSSPTNGFYYIDSALTYAVHYSDGPHSPVKITQKRSHALLQENDTLLWIRVYDIGICLMNPKTNSIKLVNNTRNKAFFGGSMVLASPGVYWFCTEEHGVFRMTRKDNGSYTFRQYGEQDGLSSSFTTQLLFDNHKNLIVCTQHGPSCYMPKEDRFVDFSANNLITDKRGEYSDIYCSPDGYAYTGSLRKYTRWYTDSIVNSTTKPRLYLTSIKIFDKEYNDTIDPDKIRVLELPYDKNTVSISFTALEYNAPGATRYIYRVDGIDSVWVPVTNTRTVTLSRLAPEKYLVHVRAVSGLGVHAAREITLMIVIKPPFWKTWWFMSLSIAFAIGLTVFIFRLRVAAIRKEENTKTRFNKMMAEVEMKALRAQMNPHFLFNCLNSINRYIVVNDTVKASGYLTKFSKLIRLILDNSANDITTLENEINLLRLYIEMEFMRFDGRFTYTIEVDDNLATDTISIPSMIIQPYIENAIWHGLLNKGENGHLSLKVTSVGPSELQVIVEDNGIGRQKASDLKSKSTLKQKSYGMKITNDRIKAMNQLYDSRASVQIQDMHDAQNEPTGTRVVLNIPFNKLTIDNNFVQFL